MPGIWASCRTADDDIADIERHDGYTEWRGAQSPPSCVATSDAESVPYTPSVTARSRSRGQIGPPLLNGGPATAGLSSFWGSAASSRPRRLAFWSDALGGL